MNQMIEWPKDTISTVFRDIAKVIKSSTFYTHQCRLIISSFECRTIKKSSGKPGKGTLCGLSKDPNKRMSQEFPHSRSVMCDLILIDILFIASHREQGDKAQESESKSRLFDRRI